MTLDGKTFLVTGGGDGLGKATAVGLAQAGGRVLVVARDRSAARAAESDIRRQAQNEAVEGLAADLSDQAQVRALAATVRGNLERLDGLVRSAGVNLMGERRSVDGLELMLAVNYLGDRKPGDGNSSA